MKKLLSILLAVMLLLSVSSVAMAVDGEGGTVQPSGNQSQPVSYTHLTLPPSLRV